DEAIDRGHGFETEALLETNPDDWWEDTLEAYKHLRNLGYEEIAVAGLSLGGALGLKLANCEKVKAVIPMCTPIFFDNEKQLTYAFTLFAKQYKQFEQKNDTQIEQELEALMAQSRLMFESVGKFIQEVNEMVDMIDAPTCVRQCRKDQISHPQSANFIYENVETDHKEIKWYEKSGHVITTDMERDVLQDDILRFLESLDWEN